ncbi:Uncharacterised protein [Mycobacteroides abscessus]|nr:Uncharacterised protein [Mycobacteroides abscessus]
MDGSTYAPTADAAKATEPIMFSHVPCHVRASVSHRWPRSRVARTASADDTRNATEP